MNYSRSELTAWTQNKKLSAQQNTHTHPHIHTHIYVIFIINKHLYL